MVENKYDNYIENLERLANEIKAWNKEDAEELCDLLNEFDETCSKLNCEYYLDHDMSRYGIDMCQLPSYEIPEGVELYPIWAMDVDNMCVVGGSLMINNGIFQTETLEEIEEHYKGEWLIMERFLVSKRRREQIVDNINEMIGNYDDDDFLEDYYDED